MVRTVYQRVKQLMFQQRAGSIDRWTVTRQLIMEGYDQEEVEEAISLLHYPVGFFYEKYPGQIALVK